MRSAWRRSPTAGRPSPPSGFGPPVVPEASTTAEAVSRSSSPPWSTWTVNGVLVAPGVDEAVAPLTGEADDPVPEPDVDVVERREGVGERRQVPLGPLEAGRVRRGIRLPPAGGGEQPGGGRVDQLGPGGEQPHVAPAANGGADRRSLLEDDDVEAALGRVRGGSQPDGSGADDDERLGCGGGGHAATI